MFRPLPSWQGVFLYVSVHSLLSNPDSSRLLDEWVTRLTDMAGGKLPTAEGFVNQRYLNREYYLLRPRQYMELADKYNAKYAIVHINYPYFSTVLYQNKLLKLVRLR